MAEKSATNTNVSKYSSTNLFPFIPDYAVRFLLYSKNVRNLSPRTINEYYLDLRTFFRFLMLYRNLCDSSVLFSVIDASGCPIDVIKNLKLSDLYEYLNFVIDQRENKVRARMRKISNLRTFFKYLDREALITDNPTLHLETPQNRNKLPVYLTVNESEKLLECVDDDDTATYKERNYAIITLFLNCGLRLSELVGLNTTSISGTSMKVLGKGNKERVLFLNPACTAALNDYLKVRPSADRASDQNALFVSRNGNRISRRMVQTIVKKYLEMSGLDPKMYSTHKLRHTAATLMYQNGVDVRALQEVLGHENLATTQIYTHLASKQVEEAVNANPLGHIEKRHDHSLSGSEEKQDTESEE